MSSQPPKRPVSTSSRKSGKRPVSSRPKSAGKGGGNENRTSKPKAAAAKPKAAPKAGQQAAQSNRNSKRVSKRMSKRRQKEFSGEYLLIDLGLYADDGKTDYTVTHVKKMIDDASVVRRHGAVLDATDKICVCFTNWDAVESKRYKYYADALFSCKKKLMKHGVQYVLMNQLFSQTASRKNAKYNYENMLPFYDIVARAVHIVILHPLHEDLITTALTYRALSRNTVCQYSVYDVLKPGGFFQRARIQDDGSRIPLPDGFNVGFFYNSARVRRGFDGAREQPTKAGAFLKRRDLKNRRHLIELYRKGDEFSAIGPQRQNAYSDFADAAYSIAKMREMPLSGLRTLLKVYPTASMPYPVVDDPFIRLELLYNVFEVISSGLLIQPKQELRQLARISGKSDPHVFACAFLVAFFRGYVDLRGKLTIQTVMRATQSWLKNLFGNATWDDGQTLRIPCCSIEGHCLEMTEYQPANQNRRLVYSAKGIKDGGECCYRYMMGKYLPEVKIVES